MRWAFEVMLNADELGINSTNVDAAIADLDKQPKAVQRLFAKDGATADMAAKMKLPADWAYQVIKQVGSYGEVFDRHLGPATPFKLKREGSQNASARLATYLTSPPPSPIAVLQADRMTKDVSARSKEKISSC